GQAVDQSRDQYLPAGLDLQNRDLARRFTPEAIHRTFQLQRRRILRRPLFPLLDSRQRRRARYAWINRRDQSFVRLVFLSIWKCGWNRRDRPDWQRARLG